MGLGLQALGLAGGGDTSVGLNSAGEGGVFSALHWNSESARRKRSRHWIRPDFHLPYDKSFDEMSYRELVFGMVCVLQSIMKSQDARFSAEGYLEHFKYITLKEIRPTYTAKSVAKYEHDVTSKVAEGIVGFMAAEHTANATHFGIENTKAYIEAMRLLQQQTNNQQGGRQGNHGNQSNQRGGNSAPRIWCPDDVCASWNFTTCTWNPCHKQHVCCICRGNHMARGGCNSTSGHPQYGQQQHYYNQQQQYQQSQQQQYSQQRGQQQQGGGNYRQA